MKNLLETEHKPCMCRESESRKIHYLFLYGSPSVVSVINDCSLFHALQTKYTHSLFFA